MKKYNLSEIMKMAWKLVKKAGLSISEELKKAWQEAKGVKEKFGNCAKILKGGSYGGIYESDFFTFKRWEKFGKKRIYINDYKGRTIGYLDGDNYKEYDRQGNYPEAIEFAIADFKAKYEF